MATAASQEYVQKMFIAFLGRAAAQGALDYYGGLIDTQGDVGKDILFADLYYGDHGNSLYSGKSTIQVIKLIFNNVMNRDPADEGLIYWYNQITDGVVNIAEAAAVIADSAANTPADLAELNAKTTAATAVTAELVANPGLLAGYQTNFLLARDSLGDVTAANVGSFDAAAEVASVSAGYASNTVLETGNDTVTGTAGFVDVVTGTVGTDATYSANDSITDPGTGDGDILNLSGDAGFTFGTVTKFENVNVSLADTLGGGFTIAGANNVTGGTINVDVADTVTVVGVELAGETVVTIGGALTSNVSTTDVTSLTATAGAGDITITGDADLATLDVEDIGTNDTAIVLSAAAVDVDLDGTTGGNDTASVSGVGVVDLDMNDGAAAALVEKVTLSGNGAAVEFQISNVDSAGNDAGDVTYTVAGDQNVTLSGAGDQFNTSTLVDTNTGTTTLELSAAGGTDVWSWGVLSGGIELSASIGANTLIVASGNTIKVAADQAGAIVIDANDTANDSTMTLDMDNDTVGITTTDVETLTIDSGTAAVTIAGVLDANDAAVTIAGTNSFTITNDMNSADLTVGGLTAFTAEEIDTDGTLSITVSGAMSASDAVTVDNDATITADSISLEQLTTTVGDATLTSTGNDITHSAAVDVSGNLTVVAADNFGGVAGGDTLSVDNDISITADDFNAPDTVDTLEGDMTITVTNDVDIDGALGVDGALTITQTATTGEVNFGAAVDVDNDVNITSATEVIAASTVTVNAGDLNITSQNEIDMDAAATTVTAGSITMETLASGAGDIDVTGFLVTAQNDITLTSADSILVGDVGNTNGDVVLTAANDIQQDATGAWDVNLGSVTLTSNGAGDTNGFVNIDGGMDVDNDVTISGDKLDIDAAITSNAGNISITSGNDTSIATAGVTATAGSITITSTRGAAGDADEDVGVATALSAANDITVSGDDVSLADVTSTATGNVTVTAANDVTLTGDVASTTTQGNITVTAGGAITINATKDLSAENDITISATAGGVVTLNDSDITADAGNIRLTGGQFANGSGTVLATAGSITVNSTNDSLTSTIGTLTAENDSVTIVNGTYAVTAVNTDAGGLTIAGDSSGTFGAVAAENSGVYLTTSGNVTATTIDSDVVAGSGTGNYALGTVTSSAQTYVQITTGSGDDSMTLTGEQYTVSTGDGADTITLTSSTAGTVINTGGGDDTVALDDVTIGLGTIAMGDGTGDTIDLTAGEADYSGHGVWTGVEILNLLGGGTVTLSEAQIDNDATFQVRGGNSTISVTGNTVDVSGVTFLAGNTSSFSLAGTAGADTLVGAESADTLDGAGGADSLTGGLGGDTFVVNSGDTGLTAATALTINDFVSGTDTLDVDDATGTYAEADGAAQTFATFLTAAATSFSGAAVDIYASYNMGGSGNTYILIDEDGDGTVSANDTLIILVGVDEAGEIDGGDFG